MVIIIQTSPPSTSTLVWCTKTLRTSRQPLTASWRVSTETLLCSVKTTFKLLVATKQLLMPTIKWWTIEKLLTTKRKLTRFWQRSYHQRINMWRIPLLKSNSLWSYQSMLKKWRTLKSKPDQSAPTSQQSPKSKRDKMLRKLRKSILFTRGCRTPRTVMSSIYWSIITSGKQIAKVMNSFIGNNKS